MKEFQIRQGRPAPVELFFVKKAQTGPPRARETAR